MSTFADRLKCCSKINDFWQHHGSFSIELVSGTYLVNVPDLVKVHKNEVVVSRATICKNEDQFEITRPSFERRFRVDCSCIKFICDNEGNFLWVNEKWRYVYS